MYIYIKKDPLFSYGVRITQCAPSNPTDWSRVVQDLAEFLALARTGNPEPPLSRALEGNELDLLASALCCCVFIVPPVASVRASVDSGTNSSCTHTHTHTYTHSDKHMVFKAEEIGRDT